MSKLITNLKANNTNGHLDFRPALPEPGLSLWWRQFIAVLAPAIQRSIFSKRVLVALVLILLPLGLLTMIGIESMNSDDDKFVSNINQARMTFGIVYSTFILAAILYIGNALMFTSLVRGEILERSIHYPMLAPVRREILILGRFIGGLISAFLLFGLATIVCYLVIYLPFGSTRLITDLSSGIALEQLSSYLLMTFLACMGYGSVFMATGLVFRNPLIPVLAVAGWEIINFLLPPALKVISVVYYLKNLMPIFIEQQGLLPLAVVAEPLPVWVSVFGILLLATISISIAIFYLRRMEIRYAEDS
jgi:ABC-type transport system involved in multi-copper enzyme maturation permease subunit